MAFHANCPHSPCPFLEDILAYLIDMVEEGHQDIGVQGLLAA
jgi:hypothetical protein